MLSHVWDEVGDGVYRRRYESLDLNIGLVVGADQVLVIDSRASHGQAAELGDDLRVITDLPVRRLVNTHWHWDHVWGNHEFGEATIIGHTRCRDRLISEGEERRREVLEADWLSDDARHQIEEVVITPPTETFDRRHVVDVGGRRVRLDYPGRGHTDADIVVTVDDVAFVGDLVEEGAPPSFGDAYPPEWVATLDELIPCLPATVIPGHGDQVDVEFVRGQRDEIAAAIVSLQEGGPAPFPEAVMESIRGRMAR